MKLCIYLIAVILASVFNPFQHRQHAVAQAQADKAVNSAPDDTPTAEQQPVQWIRTGLFGRRLVAVPAQPAPPSQGFGQAAPLPTGMDWDKIKEQKVEVVQGGVVTQADIPTAAQLLARDKLPDDSGKPHLSVISRDAGERKRVVGDLQLAPALAKFRDTHRVQAYDPTNAIDQKMIEPFKLEKDVRFAQSKVTILVQPTEGKDRRSKVTPIYGYQGPEHLAMVLAQRLPDPLYDPNKNPEPKLGGGIDLSKVPSWAWLLGGGLIVFFLLSRRQNAGPQRAS